MIPYGRQSVSEADINAVVEVLQGDWLTQGPAVEAFETALATMVEAKHAIAYSSATAALHGACFAAEIGPGDQVGVPALTFAASAACASYVGATPQLLDVDPDTLNLDLSLVTTEMKAVVPVLYAGLPFDWKQRLDCIVIEDASHAIGAMTPHGPVGNCAFSDMTVFSFHPVKTATSAEGGMVTTNDDVMAERLRRFRHHGIERQPEVGPSYYVINEVGYNYRLSDIHAALGASQLASVPGWVQRRNEIAGLYGELLDSSRFRLPAEPALGWVHGRHLYQIRCQRRDELQIFLRDQGIGTQVHYVPLTHHPAYRGDTRPADCPNVEQAWTELLSLPMFPLLTDEQVEHIAGVVNSFPS